MIKQILKKKLRRKLTNLAEVVVIEKDGDGGRVFDEAVLDQTSGQENAASKRGRHQEKLAREVQERFVDHLRFNQKKFLGL